MIRVSFLVSFLVSFFLVAGCPIMGQPPGKKALQQEGFSQWYTMDIVGISPNGQWVSYSHSYEKSIDTLLVRNVKSGIVQYFPGGRCATFGNGFLTCTLPDAQLGHLDLATGHKKVIEKVLQWEILDKGKYFLTVEQTPGDKCKQLCLRNRKGDIILSFADVTEYSLEPTYKRIAYITLDQGIYTVFRYDNNHKMPLPLYSSKQNLHTLCVNKDGVLAFLEETADEQCNLNLVSGKDRSSFLVDKDIMLQVSNDDGLKVSNDGQMVFFRASPISSVVKEKETGPQIWSASDSIIYPARKELAKYGRSPDLYAWIPYLQKLESITGNSIELASLSGKQHYAVIADSKQRGQDGRLYGSTDISIKSLQSGTRTILLKGYTADHNMLRLSPLTDALAYYKDESWWHYDMATQKHSLLAGKRISDWDNSQNSLASELELYGSPVWSEDGRYIFLFDEFDIWKACPGEAPIRLTKGREKGITFRLDKSIQEYPPEHYQYSSLSAAYVRSSAPMVLHARGENNKEGYFIYDGKEKEWPLIYGDFIADQLQLSQNGSYIARQQSFDRSPALIHSDKVGAVKKMVVRSNLQQDKYLWGKAEYVYYEGPKGEKLRAALIYPAGYDAAKKYPMVVHIYHSLSSYKYKYTNPGNSSRTGFNISNYMLDGYFVLLPDIAYVMGSPAESATFCVEAAVKKVLDLYAVDVGKIGLIGHSFGGYETIAILTKSGVFATAVAGAGVSDNIGWYFTSSPTFHNSEAWRFEEQQYRMRLPFFKDKQRYLDNSPLFNADSINTPLLLWTGASDITVPYTQSISMYYALRRLGKKCTLLIYPYEGHVIMDKKNQEDLSLKIKQWFDYYLKDRISNDWMR